MRLMTSPPVVGRDDERQRANALAAIGYATLRPDDTVDDGTRRRWLHRHVALLVEGAVSPHALRWLRDLAMASPRAHLVLQPADAESPPLMRERAIDWLVSSQPPVGSAPTAVRLARARGCARRGRTDAALTWWRAAARAAARRRDEGLHADALWEYGHAALGLRDPISLRQVRSMCREALGTLSSPGPRSRVVAVASAVALRLGDIDTARAWLSGLEVECRLTDCDVPPWIAAQQVDVALWLGEWKEAARALMWLPRRTGEAEGRSALVAWLRQDRTAFSVAPDSGPHEGPDGWWRVATIVHAAARGEGAAVRAAAAGLAADWSVPWARAIAAEALRCVAATSEAEALLSRARRQSAFAPLEAALLAHLSGARDAGSAIARWGAPGIRRWGERRTVMTMWGGVSALVDEVNNAEDDRAALRRGCRWVRVHTGAARVMVVSAASSTPLVADPEGTAPGDDDVRAPVRQAGITIGWVVAARHARDADELAGCVRTLAAVCAPALRACQDVARVSDAGDVLTADLLGHSPAMVALRAAVARAAPTTFPVLIEGESGVGKELVARALHRLSARRDRRLAAINCAALTDELFEAEVFGHTRGAFTGAVGARTGLFEDAHQGTVFLDEVGELSSRAQAKLLRVLQEGEVRRVGDNHARSVDVRIVAATNRSLAAAVAAGAYREDLRFRLAVVRLTVPPLRERVEDVPGLAQTFWVRATRHRDTRAWLAPDALAALCRYDWPGNVRELQNVMAGLVLAAPDRGRVTARHVASVVGLRDEASVSLDDARRALDRRLVTAALARHGGCRAAAARDLGVSRQGLGKLMARLQVTSPGVASRANLR